MKKPFKRVYIEITNVCNLNCSFCPKTKRQKQFLTKTEFEHIVKKVEGYTDHLYFHVMGEPLLHPNLSEFLKIANEHHLFINLTTNGTKINEASTVLLNNAPRKVSFSLHSYEGNKNNISLEDYLNPIIDFSKKAIQKNIIVEFRLWNLKNNANYSKLNERILSYIINQLGLLASILNNLYEQGGVTLQKNCYLGFDNEFTWPDEHLNLNYQNQSCLALKDQIAVLCDGTVVPCCLDFNGSIPLGNIFNNNLSEILSNTLVKQMQTGFQNKTAVCKLCQNCSYAKQKFN